MTATTERDDQESVAAEIGALVRSWGLREVRPTVADREAAGEFPRDLYREMGELGFFGCCFAERYGGTGAGFRALAAVSESLAWVYPPLSASMNLQAATVPLTIANWGSPTQAERWVPGLIGGELLGANAMTEPDGGSDFLGAMRTRAVRDGDSYVINGAKLWITNANVADVVIVYAKTDPAAGHRGVTAFLVPTDTPGFEATRVPCRGLGKLMPTNAVSLTDVRVPADAVLGEEGGGFVVAMNAMDYGRLTVASRSVGLAQACLDAALEYANQRTAFGEPIGSFQMVKKQLADMTVEVAAARSLVQAAAARYDDGDLATRQSSIAKYYAGEVCNRAAQATAEIFGGAAFSDDLPIGLYLNFAKLWQTGEGSANIQAVLIADDALGWKDMDRHRSVLKTEVMA
ncbi:acyl-CoA dehydrogenase family protein [Nocardioides nitrophenolicus]|uniref:acyl-CoA dehydrogenase family protein n=1 Tax=Nocardioides nitrophenolicus TaxID=60489 RepID=UPI00195EE6C7|nr:acyl-CoA dehydrogenase family protein [Nocardioides nitrophenolicus]MBM7516488.1 alkylation response protein AidB-like acyl-CoA dehydrogenase [Nocardioides nitrophenolicus]